MSASLVDRLIPENWDFYLLFKIIYIQLPFRISLHQPTYKQRKQVTRKWNGLLQCHLKETPFCQQDHIIHTQQNVLYCVQKHSYLNNLPLSLVSWSSLKRVIWQHFSPFMGKKKGERKSAPRERAGLRCHTRSEALGCAAPRRGHPCWAH